MIIQACLKENAANKYCFFFIYSPSSSCAIVSNSPEQTKGRTWGHPAWDGAKDWGWGGEKQHCYGRKEVHATEPERFGRAVSRFCEFCVEKFWGEKFVCVCVVYVGTEELLLVLRLICIFESVELLVSTWVTSMYSWEALWCLYNCYNNQISDKKIRGYKLINIFFCIIDFI